MIAELEQFVTAHRGAHGCIDTVSPKAGMGTDPHSISPNVGAPLEAGD